MPWNVLRFEDTPNPDALKCVLDRPIADTPRAYRSPDDAAGDVVAAALFAIPGVRNLLLLDDWVTVGRHPGTPWKAIRNAVRKALEQAP